MLEANRKKRKQKMRGAILQTATEHIQGNIEGPFYWGQSIYYVLARIWETAFNRGYDKALRDQAKETDNGTHHM